MADTDNSLFAAGIARLNKHLHAIGRTSPRKKIIDLQDDQFPQYDPESPIASDLMRRRNPGRKLTSFVRMGEGMKPGSQGRAFAQDGKAYVPERLSRSASKKLGRPLIMNHEFEHAYTQPSGTHHSVVEIAPSIGDMVFQSQSFRRQAGKPLTGKIPVGFKNQDAEWMRMMAQKHGYFDGRSMTDLLRTPAGISWLRQAALGPMAGSVPKEFDPLAPNRRDLPLPTAPVQLPALPDDGYIPAHIINEPSASKRASMLTGWKMMSADHRKTNDNQALKALWPAPSHQSPQPRSNQVWGRDGDSKAPVSLSNRRVGNIGLGLEDKRMQNLDPSSPIRYPDVTGHTGGNPYLEAHDTTRYPGQDLDTVVPRPGGNIRSLLKSMEDNPMGGYSTPSQSIFTRYPEPHLRKWWQ